MARIPVALLTGFLGSGKTTLLNRLLRAHNLARTMVIINEFGEIGLDHKFVAASDDAVVLLENGCLCCSVRGDLVATLGDLHLRSKSGEIAPFDRVVIETSGVADPSAVIQAFLSEPTLAARYRVDAVIATVDAINGPASLDAHVESVRQAALADHILVTMLDLLDPERAKVALASLTERLRRLNPAARIARADDPALDLAQIIRGAAFDPDDAMVDPRPWLNAAAYEPDDHPHVHDHGEADGHEHDPHERIDRKIHSFCIVRDEPIAARTLQLVLDALTQNLGPNLLRVKGIVHVAEEPDRPAVIQGAQQLLHTLAWLDRWPDDNRKSRIVFITHGAGRAAVEEVIALIERMAARTAAARNRAGTG